jgi:hypothetical protein
MSLCAAACLSTLVFASPSDARPGARSQPVPPGPELELTVQEQRRDRIPFIAVASPARSQPQLLGGNWAGSDGVVMGVGMFRVPKMNRNDPNRSNPLHDSSGKTMGVAAVGLSLRF